MENVSLSTDAWNDATTSSSLSDSDDVANSLAYIRSRVLKLVYIMIGTLGVVDNLFVIVVFVLFIKITDKVQSPLEKFRLLYVVPVGLLAVARCRRQLSLLLSCAKGLTLKDGAFYDVIVIVFPKNVHREY